MIDSSDVTQLDTDYLVIGAGAMGMAFVDEILKHDKTATVLFVERRARTGGHWVDAYDHVQLHQPAIAYGVNSLELSENKTDLSSRPQIINYFEKLTRSYSKSGRVRFLFKCDYVGDELVDTVRIADVHSNLERSVRYKIEVRKKIVDSGYMRVEVPATHPPAYSYDSDVALVPPNSLTKLERPPNSYLIIGAGKTGIDAVLYLLDSGVSPARIEWVVSNDMWLWPREKAAPEHVGDMLADQLEAFVDCPDIDSAFLRMEERGIVFRMDEDILPTKWRCATVSMPELKQLKTLTNVIREGRVARLSHDSLAFESGVKRALAPNTLVVNCSANGLSKRPEVPVFEGDRITLQPVLICQQVFSAAYIGKLETTGLSEQQKNDVSHPVLHPEQVEDLPLCLVQGFENQINGNRKILWWLWRSRLNLLAQASLLTYLRIGFRLFRLTPKGRQALSKFKGAQHRSGSLKSAQDNRITNKVA